MQQRLHPLWMPLYRFLDFFVQKPMRGLLLICALQMVGWGILVTFFMPIPYTDILFHSFLGISVEANFWGRWYMHHHPLSAYLLTHWLNFGEPLLVYPHNIAAQIFVIATYVGVYYMGLALLNNKRDALVCVLLLIPLGVYQGAPVLEYNHGYLQGLNHNVLQYPFWVLLPLVTFYATRPLREKARQSFWWLVLGVLSGMGLWTKISIGILHGTLLVWTLIDREARLHYKTVYPYLAMILCLLIGSMTIYYGIHNWSDGAHYVLSRASAVNAFNLADHDSTIHILVSFAYMVGVAIVARGISMNTRLMVPFAHMTGRLSFFLLFVTFVPFAVILVGSVYRQVSALFSWTLPMYAMWGIVLVALMRSTWRTYTPHVILLAAVVLLLKPVYYYPLAHGFYPKADNHWVISEKVVNQWKTQTNNAPLVKIYGDYGKIGGVVSLYAGIDGAEGAQAIINQETTVNSEDLKRHGALFVFDNTDWGAGLFRQAMKILQVPEQSMKIDEYHHVIYYAIVPPAEP